MCDEFIILSGVLNQIECTKIDDKFVVGARLTFITPKLISINCLLECK